MHEDNFPVCLSSCENTTQSRDKRAACDDVTCYVCVQICLWRFQQASDQPNARGAAGVPASNAAEELMSRGKNACNSFALSWLPLGGPTSSSLHIVSAYEDGSVMHQTAVH